MQAIYPGEGAISELLDMVWRKGPLMMRVGDCALGNSINTRNGGSPVTSDLRDRFVAMLQDGHAMEDIAAETGVHYQTVVKHTRHVRLPANYPRRIRRHA
jgi:hypothetical protein